MPCSANDADDMTDVPDVPDVSVHTTADGSNTLYSSTYGQTFHSDKGALAESRHVFIEGSKLPLRLSTQKRVRILEVGLGTGLNFVLSAQEARLQDAQLEYYALEKTLLPRAVLEPLNYHVLLNDPDVWQQFLAWRQGVNGVSAAEAVLGFDWHNVKFEVLLGDARARVLDLGHVVCAASHDPARDDYQLVDIVYHDAFSFDANSELWCEVFLQHLGSVLKPGGVLVTYSVKGLVRRRLAAVGFQVEKLPGPVGGKREMLLATKLG